MEMCCKQIKAADGSELAIHTNKQEGPHTHLKRKMKHIMGTSADYVEGYVTEAVFWLNCEAKKINIFEEFLNVISIES